MRLIDADALMEVIREHDYPLRSHFNSTDNGMFTIGVQQAVDEATTIDAVPVVRGEWKMDTDPDDGDCRCSSCKVCIDALHKRNHGLLNALGFKLHTFYNYCPNCGARMDGEQ